MNKLLLIPIALLLLVSCSSTPHKYDDETLAKLTKAMKKTGDYISGNFLLYYGPKNLPKSEQKELTSAFHTFLKLYSSIEPDYQAILAVKQFLVIYLNSSHNYNPKKNRGAKSKEESDNTPLAVANSLINSTKIELNRINDLAYLKELSLLLAISEEQLYHGLYYLLTHSKEE